MEEASIAMLKGLRFQEAIFQKSSIHAPEKARELLADLTLRLSNAV
jgi:hypothetical protein